MNNEELLAKYKALFPDNVEAIVVRKDDYDRLYGDLTIENIELKQEIERLNNILNKIEATIKWAYEESEYQGAIYDIENTIKELKGEDKE